MNEYSVLVQDIVKSYGNTKILKNLSMKVETGQIYGLLGASGCGKTTLLNAIIGRKKVESGEIWVLGEKQGVPGAVPLGKQIGYMPQDIALVREFTVRDAIFYFGRIFQMKEKTIQKRFEELSDLLNLPPEDRFLKDCSGGQQRRVSFAVALVHTPKLLILDEPTVGIDPLLREKIWSYIVEITKKEKISVIITTHYIEECRQADKVGLMRNGKLLVEGHPTRLMSKYGTNTLEEVFLILSKTQNDGELSTKTPIYIESDAYLNEYLELSTLKISPSVKSFPDGTKSELTKKTRRNFNVMNKRRMGALLNKNSKQFYRNLTAVVFLLMMPIIQILIMIYSTGLDMKNISIGIVNDESMSAFCPNFTRQGTTRAEIITNDCHFKNLSCRFFQELDKNPMFIKVQYDTLEEAYLGVLHGKITAMLHFPKNFSSSVEHRLNQGRNADILSLQFGQIQVRMDMSNQQVGTTVKAELTNTYLRFQKELFKDCLYLQKLAEPPVHTEFIYGSNDEPYQIFMMPGALMTMAFFFGSILTSQIMVTEKHEGIWDRSIVAGVTSTELTVSHLCFQGLVVFCQTLEMVVLIYAIYEFECAGSVLLMLLIVYLEGICGMSYGMFVSTISPNISMTNNAVLGFYLPILIISGTLWPVEGMPKSLQILANSLPCSLPIEALRNVTRKGLSVLDLQVAAGMFIIIAWIIIFSLLSLFFLRRQR